MKRIKILFVVTFTLALVSCGGGSSSDGSGSANGAPGPTKFAGNYKGSIRTNVSQGGQSAAQTDAATMTIGNDGRVTINSSAPANGVVCPAPPPVFINGDTIPISANGTCFLPGAGNCTVKTNGSMKMSGATGIGQSSGTISCTSAGTFSVRYEFGFTRV
jgi:hypothetical protein